MIPVFLMRVRYVGWRCAMGIHRGWFTDAAVIFSVRRCVNCGDPESRALGEMVDEERKVWRRTPRNLPFDKQANWVFMNIGKSV